MAINPIEKLLHKAKVEIAVRKGITDVDAYDFSVENKTKEFLKAEHQITTPINLHEFEFVREATYMVGGNRIILGKRIVNPTAEQASMQKMVDVCRQSPMMAATFDYLAAKETPLYHDPDIEGCDGYYSPSGKYIVLKHASPEPTTNNYLTTMEEALHGYDFLKHGIDDCQAGEVFSPIAETLWEVNLEASAKARKIAACYEIGGQMWQDVVESKGDYGSMARRFEQSVDNGDSMEKAIAHAYYRLRLTSILDNDFRDFYIGHSLGQEDSREQFSPETKIQYYKNRNVDLHNLKPMRHEILMRAGHIPGTETNFLSGFNNLMAPVLCTFAEKEYAKVSKIYEGLGLTTGYHYNATNKMMIPSEMLADAQNLIQDRHRANVDALDRIKKNPIASGDNVELCEAVQTGEAYRKLDELFANAQTYQEDEKGNRHIVDGVVRLLWKVQPFDHVYNEQRENTIVQEQGIAPKILPLAHYKAG